MRVLTCSMVCLLLTILAATAQAQKAVKVRVRVRGAVSDGCVKAIREALAGVPGIKVNTDEMQPGEKRHYFSSPVVVEIADTAKTDLGAIAKAVAAAKTPHREEIPPSLNLVLFGQAGDVTEPNVMQLRAALMEVRGVEAMAPGGIGAIATENSFWARLNAEAAFADIDRALKAANLRWQYAK